MPLWATAKVPISTRALLQWAELQLAGSKDIPNARWEARHMLQDHTGWSPTEMVMEPDRLVPNPERYRAWIEVRKHGVPASRITGFRNFMGHRFAVSRATLDPRPDSECLVEAALNLLPPDWAGHILDLGTGTGCLLLSLLAERPAATGKGIDLSADAVRTAAENAAALGLENQAAFAVGCWSQDIRPQSVDLIISNPPYIRSDVMPELDAAVLEHDPARALDGGQDGLAAYKAILADAPRILRLHGLIIVEIGWDQREAVHALLDSAGFDTIRAITDLAGRDRVITAQKKEKTVKKHLE